MKCHCIVNTSYTYAIMQIHSKNFVSNIIRTLNTNHFIAIYQVQHILKGIHKGFKLLVNYTLINHNKHCRVKFYS